MAKRFVSDVAWSAQRTTDIYFYDIYIFSEYTLQV